jgi:hypothetical protein
MLFDLRSRGRRRVVQVIYVGLAILMLGGLVLFGVGAGNNNGGLLNAFTNNGSGNGQSAAVDSQTKAALKAVDKSPKSASAWASLVQARFDLAGEGKNYDTTTSTYTKSGKAQLQDAANAWTHYLSLTGNKPQVELATLMARAYAALEQYSNESSAWEFVASANPTSSEGFLCLAFSAYAAKQNRKAALAGAQAVKLAPKLQQLTIKQELTASKSSAQYAQEC